MSMHGKHLLFLVYIYVCTHVCIYIHICTYIYVCINTYMYIYIYMCVCIPSYPINHVYSLPGKWISKKYFTCRSIQIFKILFRGFVSRKSNENLILRTRSCGTALITQHSWLLHFRQAEICLVEMICTSVVPASKGLLGGASP